MISRNCTKSVQMGQVWTELAAAWSSRKEWAEFGPGVGQLVCH